MTWSNRWLPSAHASRAAQEPGREAGVLVGCQTYWGSHGCEKQRGHRWGHFCCCACGGWLKHRLYRRREGCVGRAPYYGRQTNFYGVDAAPDPVTAFERGYISADELVRSPGVSTEDLRRVGAIAPFPGFSPGEIMRAVLDQHAEQADDLGDHLVGEPGGEITGLRNTPGVIFDDDPSSTVLWGDGLPIDDGKPGLYQWGTRMAGLPRDFDSNIDTAGVAWPDIPERSWLEEDLALSAKHMGWPYPRGQACCVRHGLRWVERHEPEATYPTEVRPWPGWASVVTSDVIPSSAVLIGHADTWWTWWLDGEPVVRDEAQGWLDSGVDLGQGVAAKHPSWWSRMCSRASRLVHRARD